MLKLLQPTATKAKPEVLLKMKITKRQLRKLIREAREGWQDTAWPRPAGEKTALEERQHAQFAQNPHVPSPAPKRNAYDQAFDAGYQAGYWDTEIDPEMTEDHPDYDTYMDGFDTGNMDKIGGN